MTRTQRSCRTVGAHEHDRDGEAGQAVALGRVAPLTRSRFTRRLAGWSLLRAGRLTRELPRPSLGANVSVNPPERKPRSRTTEPTIMNIFKSRYRFSLENVH